MKYAIPVLFALLLAANVNAQLKPAVSYPVSPDVATLAKYIDFPVGTYSGVPEISIPLYTVQYKSISIPLALSYHASGIKVDDEAGRVGLGWDLFSGGFITQAVIGNKNERDYPDSHFRNTWGYPVFKARFADFGNYGYGYEVTMGAGWDCGANVPEGSLIWDMRTKGLGEPDVFTFSFPGGSGKFILDPDTDEPLILKKEGEFIILKLVGTNAGWKIKTPDGREYIFNKFGAGTITDGDGNISKTWMLTKITGPDGAEINFEYDGTYAQSTLQFSESYVSQVNPYIGGERYKKYDGKSTSVTNFFLTKISTPTTIVEFIPESRDDNGTPHRLKEFVIKDFLTSKKIKSFEFLYDYFVSSASGGTIVPITPANQSRYTKRLKLLAVREVGYSGETKVYNPPHSFHYEESVQLPSKVSCARDYWGYYNGVTDNTTLLPKLPPLHYDSSDFNDIPTTLFSSPYQANRGPSAAHMQAGMLKKITYPTGGSRTFYYEPHTFNNFSFFDASQVNTLMQPIDIHDKNGPGDPKYVALDLPYREMNVQFQITFNGGGLTTSFPAVPKYPFSTIEGSWVRLIKKQDGVETIEQTWYLPSDCASDHNGGNGCDEINETRLITSDPGVQYFVEAHLPDGSGPFYSADHVFARCTTTFPRVTVSGEPRNYGSGLRIQKIELRDETDKLALVRTYDYTSGGATTGKLLSKPRFLGKKYLTCKKLSPGNCVSGGGIVHQQRFFQYTVYSGNTSSLAFSQNSGFVGYSAVTVNEVSTDGSVTNSKVRYEFINNQNVFAGDYPEDPNLDNGLPSKTIYFSAAGDTVRNEINTYDLPAAFNKRVTGYTIEDLYSGPDDCADPCGGNVNANPYLYPQRWLFRSYPVRSKWYQLKTKTVKDYSGAQVKKKTVAYSYNALGMLSTETSTESNGDQLVKNYKYPVDYMGTTPPYPLVSTLHTNYYQAEIESNQTVNSIVHHKSLNTYVNPATGKYTLGSANIQNATNIVLDFINYTSFSAQATNPKEFKGKNGVNTIVLWGRNGTVPIAKIEGATLAQVNAQVNSTSVETMATASLRTELLKLYNLTKCFVQVYFYDDKGQLIEIIDPSRTSTYFEYDAFGRFSLARDHDRNIIANYQYNYINSGAQ